MNAVKQWEVDALWEQWTVGKAALMATRATGVVAAVHPNSFPNVHLLARRLNLLCRGRPRPGSFSIAYLNRASLSVAAHVYQNSAVPVTIHPFARPAIVALGRHLVSPQTGDHLPV